MATPFRDIFYDTSSRIAMLFGRRKLFMNLGYHADLGADDMKALYDRLVRDVDLNGKKVLEVGCGRGGGLMHLASSTRFSGTGMDLSPSNISVARKYNRYDTLHFRVGNATEFELDTQFDVILNLESSHCYEPIHDFFNNVYKHLMPGGSFCYSDVLPKRRIRIHEEIIADLGFKVVSREEITDRVLRSIDVRSERHPSLYQDFPWAFPMTVHNFMVTQHSNMYKEMKAGRIRYMAYTLTK